MLRLALYLLICLGFGAVGGIGSAAIGGPAGHAFAALMVLAAAATAVWLHVRYELPERARDTLRDQLDPLAGPPPGAVPVSLPLAERYAAAFARSDVKALRPLLDDGFSVHWPHAGKRMGRDAYLRAMRVAGYGFPTGELELHEVLRAGEEHWLRFSSESRPRRGEPLAATWWERWAIDPAGECILSVTHAGVVRTGPP